MLQCAVTSSTAYSFLWPSQSSLARREDSHSTQEWFGATFASGSCRSWPPL